MSEWSSRLHTYRQQERMTKPELLDMIIDIDGHFMGASGNRYITSSPEPDTLHDPSLVPLVADTDETTWDVTSAPYPDPIITFIKYVDIDLQKGIHSLQDLLQLIRSHPLTPHTQYNIDLQALHNIHDELSQIQTMVGMVQVKDAILNQLLYFLQDLHRSPSGAGDYKHTVIYGSPGSGKTELARLMGSMYAKMGVLENKTFRKVTRSDLVAGFLGQTALKTSKVIEECIGGCLFIDEVYALGPGGDGNDSFSKECIDTLCEALSNYKDNLMVIVAGYKDEVNHQFLDANRGLSSRFVWRFTLDDYLAPDLRLIFIKKVADSDWKMDDVPVSWFERHMKRFPNNGRDMEALFSYAKVAHGRRIFGSSLERRKLNLVDMNAGLETLIQHRSEPENSTPFGLYC